MCIFVVLFYYLWGLFSDARAQSRTFGRGVRLHFDLCFAVASRCSLAWTGLRVRRSMLCR